MTDNPSAEQQLAKQGLILAMAGIVARLIGLFYRIPMTNILGDEGMGYYSNAANLYSFFLIVSSYGMPAALSKLISERRALGKRQAAESLFRSSMLLNLLIGFLFSVALYYVAIPYSNFIMLPDSFLAIRALVPALFVFSLLATFRGYFQGLNTMVPTAFSQVIEQLFNAVFSLVFASAFLSGGIPTGAAGGTLGTGTGALFGLLFMMVIYGLYRRAWRQHQPAMMKNFHLNGFNQLLTNWKIILCTSIPILIGAATFHLTNLIDDVMFQRALAFHAYDRLQIATLNGILNGKYKIIITVPIAIASALAASSIPSITFSRMRQDMVATKRKIVLAYKMVLLIALPATVGAFVLARPILSLLFRLNDYADRTVHILMIGSISILFFSLSTISIGLLQGLDRLRVPIYSALKSMLIKIIFNGLLLYLWDFNLYGAVITNVIFAISSTYFNTKAVKQTVKLEIDIIQLLVMPLFASLAMGFLTFGVFKGLNRLLTDGQAISPLATVIAGLLAVLSYLFFCLRFKIIGQNELQALPLGNKLLTLARRWHLLP